MSKSLTKKEAVTCLGLDEKTFDNYFRNAAEFPGLKKSGRFHFDEGILREWKESFAWRTLELDKEDYALCLDFALAQHFRGYASSDFGTGRQREFGQKVTNWVKGLLGEVAVKKFLKEKFDVDIEIDFDIRDEIVMQDITEVGVDGAMREPKIGVGIKSGKPRSAFLVIGENEMNIEERRSDIYIFCRPDIPDDHLLRLTKQEVREVVKDKPHYSKYKDLMPDFVDIPCEIVGWCHYGDLRQVGEIPGQKFDGVRFVRESGLLRKSKEEWEELIKQL